MRFENLSFALEQPQVLKDVNLEIPSGTFVGIVGQSGSGKSTLMKLLPQLYDPEEGRILIDGYDIGKVEIPCADKSASFPRTPALQWNRERKHRAHQPGGLR